MTEKELKHLSRKELLEMLLYVSRRNEQLEHELEAAKKSIDDVRMTTVKAGSIAEASLRINKVFETAQKAADDYLEEIKLRDKDSREKCKIMVEEARKEAAEILREAKQQTGRKLTPRR